MPLPPNRFQPSDRRSRPLNWQVLEAPLRQLDVRLSLPPRRARGYAVPSIRMFLCVLDSASSFWVRSCSPSPDGGLVIVASMDCHPQSVSFVSRSQVSSATTSPPLPLLLGGRCRPTTLSLHYDRNPLRTHSWLVSAGPPKSIFSCSSQPHPKSTEIGGAERRSVALIVEARTRGQISSAEELIREYAASLGIDLGFQNFELEMAEFPRAYARPDGRILIAFEGGDAVGVVGLRKLSDKICEMKRMYVRRNFRQRGIGRMLAKRAIEEAQDIGYYRMRLDTLSRLKEAVSLYDSLGFKKIGPYTDNPQRDVVYMELDLGEP